MQLFGLLLALDRKMQGGVSLVMLDCWLAVAGFFGFEPLPKFSPFLLQCCDSFLRREKCQGFCGMLLVFG